MLLFHRVTGTADLIKLCPHKQGISERLRRQQKVQVSVTGEKNKP